MTVAFGTSTPTSTTVVATSTSMSPAAKARITGVLLLGGEPAVQHLEPQSRQRPGAQLLGDVEHGQRRRRSSAPLPSAPPSGAPSASPGSSSVDRGPPAAPSSSPIRGQTT